MVMLVAQADVALREGEQTLPAKVEGPRQDVGTSP